MIHAVAGEVCVSFALQHLCPDRSHVGEGDTGPGEFLQGVAIGRKEFLLQSHPVRVASHTGNQDELGIRRSLADLADHRGYIRLVFTGGATG
jgi:hypothetical protein